MSWQETYRDLAHLVPAVGEREDETPAPDRPAPGPKIPPPARALAGRRAWLEVSGHGRGPATRFDIPFDRTIEIGRAETAGLRLDDAQVSRLHAALISHPDGHHSICDLESANGVFLNDVRIAEAALDDGDRIGLGETVLTFRRSR